MRGNRSVMIALFLALCGITHLTESASLQTPSSVARKLITAKACSAILSPNPKPLPPYDFHKLGRGQTWCFKRSEEELEQQLKQVGGFNRRYLAITQAQALQFKNLLTFDKPVIVKSHDENMRNVSNDSKDGIIKAEDMWPSSVRQMTARAKRAVPAMPGTEVRQCMAGGSLVSGSTNLVHMCTECTATTRLDADKFPTFINEVVCHSQNFFCAKDIGICQQKAIFQTILRRTGQYVRDEVLSQLHGLTIFKEVWAEHTQQIRSCCECQVFLGKYQAF